MCENARAYATIPVRVKDGFIVRTRADLIPLPSDLAAQRKAALASGAQIVSTDVPVTTSMASAFEIPGGTPSRCNPVLAPKPCTAHDIEDPSKLSLAP